MLISSQAAPGKPQILHYPDVPVADRERRHGAGSHDVRHPLTVSQPVTVAFEFVVGEWPVVNGALLVVWRWPFDWSDLQFDDPQGEGYTTCELVPGDRSADSIRFAPRYNFMAGVEPWHHQLQVRVEGTLSQGDRVRIRCGDRSQGGGGWRAPTCAAARCEFLMLIDHRGDHRRSRLAPSPSFAVEAGPPVRLAAVVDSDGVAGQPVRVTVRAEDEWGNAARLDASPQLEAPGGTIQLIQEQPMFAEAIWDEPGRYRVRASAPPCPPVDSNEVTVHRVAPERRLYWGDLHSGQSEIGCGCGSLAEHYAYGRDCAALQFITHQANDHYVTQDDWRQTRQTSDQFDEPGRYVVLLGCEWSPLTKDGGDRNVIYRHDEPVLFRSDRFFVEAPVDPAPDLRTAPEFHDQFRDRDVLVNIHVGGRMTNLQWHEPSIEKLCETHSTHGTVEWFFMDALERGYRVGLTAGTDGVMGRPGACHPGRRLIRNSPSGLTAVYASQLSREGIWEALSRRRCYATTGERIRLWVEVNGQPLGGEFQCNGPRHVKIRVEGTSGLERVELFRGIEVLEAWSVAAPDPDPCRIRVLWSGTQRKGTARLQRMNWDGGLLADQGRLELVDVVGFSSLVDRAWESNDGLAWTCDTAGNSAGVVVRVPPSTRQLRLQAGPVNDTIALSQLESAAIRRDAGGLNCFVEVGPAPRQDGPCDFDAEWTDTSNLEQPTGYWIRVTQVNQSKAWSSPVFALPDGPPQSRADS